MQPASLVRSDAGYRGRFAPTPTGSLHFGSLVTAVGSYLCARSVGGQWHVRIDDLDRSRVVPGAADDILRTLERLGFEWSGEVYYQSTRAEAYAATLDELRHLGFVYECSCSRRELQLSNPHSGNDGRFEAELRYPGFCRNGLLAPERATATRFRVPEASVRFHDALQGDLTIDVAAEAGDFVVWRRDGLAAYQLACAVDDHAQGYTHIVRGVDLLGSTARQLLVQRALAYQTATYAHLPLALDAAGSKLSKSSAAPAVSVEHTTALLWRCLDFLQQQPPATLRDGKLQELWGWAAENWTLEPLIGLKGMALPARI